MKKHLLSLCLCGLSTIAFAQPLQDDFEGNGNITSWFGDGVILDTSLSNPHQTGINTSAAVLEYQDVGAQYANLRFDAGRNLNMAGYSSFSFKIYVPSSSVSGNSPNQVSLKLQNGSLAAPWSTQSEVIKPITLDSWQNIQIDFATDPYVNLDPNSPPPTQRSDFNRILIQLNGENNNDSVTAYIDDFYYYDSLIPPPNYNQLVWADEFNGTGAIDPSKWFHQTRLPNGVSWFNGEVQHYTNRTANTIQQGGSLHLIARKETFTDQGVTKQYTSARLNSKFAFTYGKVEVRAKLPTGVGTWPAIWMLGKNITENGGYWNLNNQGTHGWPACGEIDIMEHWGSNQDYISSAMHTPSSFGGTVNVGGRSIPGVSNNFHVYSLVWTPTKMVFSVDSVVHYTYQPAVRDSTTWPFDLDQYMLLNIAIEPSIATSFVQDTMEIDYVRVYQQGTVGMGEVQEKPEINLYPNPTEGLLNMRTGSDLINKRFQLLNLKGQTVREGRLNSNLTQINLSGMNKGIFILRLPDVGLMKKVVLR